MKSLEESVTIAMDGTDPELFPYLPYILQDLWEIGAVAETIITAIKRHFEGFADLKILDLGCGKGAVSIKLAKEFNCQCYGIDAILEFIDFAREKAKEWDVHHLCNFEYYDIRTKIDELENFDVIILGSIGWVFGNYQQTMSILKKHLTEEGVVILDDGYLPDDSTFKHDQVIEKLQLTEQIENAGMVLIDEIINENEIMISSDVHIFEKVSQRCLELMEKYPDKKSLFEDYIKQQEVENKVLEEEVICSTMVLKKSS